MVDAEGRHLEYLGSPKKGEPRIYILDRGGPEELMPLELGKEVEFFRESAATRGQNERRYGYTCKTYTLDVENFALKLFVNEKNNVPIELSVKTPFREFSIIYKKYVRDQPFNKTLYEFPPALTQKKSDGALEEVPPIDKLIDELTHGNQQAAANALIRVGGPAVDHLIPLLQKGGVTRLYAVTILAAIGPAAHKAVPQLLNCLREQHDTIGIILKQVPDMGVVSEVVGNQTAYNAGVRPGDWIIAINDRSVMNETAGKIDAMIRGQTSAFELSIRRYSSYKKIGSIEKNSLFFDSPITIRVKPYDEATKQLKLAIVRALGRIGPKASAALPDLNEYLARTEMSPAARVAIDSISPPLKRDAAQLAQALRARDESAFLELSEMKDIPPGTLFEVKEYAKRVVVRSRLVGNLPHRFAEQLVRLANNNPKWAEEIMDGQDPDICSALWSSKHTVRSGNAFPHTKIIPCPTK